MYRDSLPVRWRPILKANRTPNACVWQMVVFTAVATIGLAGCQPSNMGSVSGKVTLDGEPVSEALLQFKPLSGGGNSMAKTNETGFYTLSYTRDVEGAEVGEHEVRINSGWPGLNGSPGGPGWVPERVPPKYNQKTELKAKVKPGSNTMNFELEGALPVDKKYQHLLKKKVDSLNYEK